MSSAERNLISEVDKLLKLVLVMPSTNAISERSFSALRRVKNYLRSTMTQERLNHLLLLHELTDLTSSQLPTSLLLLLITELESLGSSVNLMYCLVDSAKGVNHLFNALLV